MPAMLAPRLRSVQCYDVPTLAIQPSPASAGGETIATADSTARCTFTLAEAQQMLPRVHALTERAAQAVDTLSSVIHRSGETDPARAPTLAELDGVVAGWAGQLRGLGLEVKGLWLVDFDNGDGYYCWQYPEVTILHYHGYDDGFAGRMKIV